MATLHIVQGGIDNGDKKRLEKAARNNLSLPSWIVPKSVSIGDEVVIYVSGYGFFATAKIKTRSKPRADWKNRYGAGLNFIKLIESSDLDWHHRATRTQADVGEVSLEHYDTTRRDTVRTWTSSAVMMSPGCSRRAEPASSFR